MHIMWPDLQKEVLKPFQFTVYSERCEYGTNLKFGDLALLTWFYSWEQFYIIRLNKLWVVTNWNWKLRKAIRPLFADPVTYTVLTISHNHASSLLLFQTVFHGLFSFHTMLLWGHPCFRSAHRIFHKVLPLKCG